MSVESVVAFPRAPRWREGIIAESAAMRALLALVERVAPSLLSVLLFGETGSGKEVLARSIHAASGRTGALVTVNCAAIPPTLAESELFGHERGAFTGAERLRPGRFEQAHQGTLLLDEIGDLEPALQGKLLRVLEDGEVSRVGGQVPFPVNVRIIAATHRDLPRLVAEGRFRGDLYHRINGVTLNVPPLRSRADDIELLARRFMIEATKAGRRPVLTDDVVTWLEGQDWPGNVRELRQAVARAVVFGGDVLIPEDFGCPGSMYAAPMVASYPAREGSHLDGFLAGKRWSEIEFVVLTWAVHRFGSVRAAARALHLPSSTVSDRVRRLGITQPHLRPQPLTAVQP